MSNKVEDSSPKLVPITFCGDCGESIPAQAMACLHCGARQAGGEKTVRVVFCEKCGEDYPSRAHACFHCGHVNPKSPLLEGHISGLSA